MRKSEEPPLESESGIAVTRLFDHPLNMDLLGTHSATHMGTVLEA